MSMMRLEDDCVECEKPCTSACPMYHPQPHYYCDVCGQECDPADLNEVNGVHVCGDCLRGYLEETGIIRRVNDDE